MILVEVLLETSSSMTTDFTSLITGYSNGNQNSVHELIDAIKPILMSVLSKMSVGDNALADDWISDFTSDNLPKVVKIAAKNIEQGKYKAGQFPALVAASFRNFALNKIRSRDLQAKREKEAGLAQGTFDDPRGKITGSDQRIISNIVRKHIDQEKDPESKAFLLHLTGLAKSNTLSFEKLTGGSINDALAAAGLDPIAWQKSGKSSKVRAKFFDRLSKDKTLRQHVGVESASENGPGLIAILESVKTHEAVLPCDKSIHDLFQDYLVSLIKNEAMGFGGGKDDLVSVDPTTSHRYGTQEYWLTIKGRRIDTFSKSELEGIGKALGALKLKENTDG